MTGRVFELWHIASHVSFPVDASQVMALVMALPESSNSKGASVPVDTVDTVVAAAAAEGLAVVMVADSPDIVVEVAASAKMARPH